MPRKRLSSFLNLFTFPFKLKSSTRRRGARGQWSGTQTPALESLEELEDRTLLSVSVTLATTSLSAAETEITITGTGFDPIVSNNTVTFNKGAEGIVTAATATSLTISFTTEPTSAGNLTAVVTSNSVSSGSPVQVATVIPDVISNSATLPADAATIVIYGDGFDTTASNNTVTFNNGAAGTVASATATQMTVTLTTAPTTAGPLNATVTTNSAAGSATQVATVAPVITSSTAALLANSNSVIIAGLGFDTTLVNDSITFDNGAVGSITAATATSLTVNLTTRPETAGSFSAVVTSNGISSGAPVQVALVTPVVTSETSQVAANASTVTISGYGFDPVVSNNSVSLGIGAVGTVISATPTSITVSFSTKPTQAGSLTAIVTTNSQTSGSATQVASITPVVTSSTASIAANASSIVIAGVGFDTIPANNTVVLSNGAAGTVTAATATSITVGFDTSPATMGSLTVIVTTNTIGSGSAVQVATVKPVVTTSTASLDANVATMTINGFGFDSATPSNNTIQFNNGAVGTVTAATATTLTVSFSTKPRAAGSLTAIVTTAGQTSGAALQVASVKPVITSSTATLLADSTTLTISGFGFDPIASRNTVSLNNGALGTVTSATNTSLTVTFSTRPATAGSLTVILTTNSQSSGSAVQVATVKPVVTSGTATLLSNATTLTITGFGFDPIAANNAVVLNNGAVGTIASATATTLTVTFTTKPSQAGSLTAIVTTNSESSGTAVQVASVKPVVLANGGNLMAASATTLTIIGTGFSTTAVNNTVTFNNGAIGAVTAATATTLSITLSVRPTIVGTLSAIVVSNSETSGAAVVVATVMPSVTVSTSSLAADASSLTITGVGFSATASQNTVVFNNGAAGTVTAASATSLTVTFSTKPANAGVLTAIVTTSSRSSGRALQVANVTPVITARTTNLAANAATVTIVGFGFDVVPSRNIVTFSSGAVGVVTASSATSLTVTFSIKPTAAGSLTASIVANGITGSSTIQIASVIPVVTANTTARLLANATTITITGIGFSTTAANNVVTFSNGAAGTVTSATATRLTVNLTTAPATAGSLTAIVVTNGRSSGTAVQVSSVVPVVTSSTSPLAADALTVTIDGFGFSTTAASNTVIFNNGAVGTVTVATATSLTVTFSTKPANAGELNAIVTSSSLSSGAAIQVGNVVPVVTSSETQVAANATTVTIGGLGFDSTSTNNVVALSNGAEGIVTAASATSLTVTFTTNATEAGSLTATVITNSYSSGAPVQVANIIPVVAVEIANPITADTNTLTINGIGFDTTIVNNTVTFNNGAVGAVTAATATSITVAFSTLPATAGVLTAIVTTNGKSSDSAVQVATIIPVVTTSTSNMAANETTITIDGFGFDPIAANNTVAFNNSAVGTVTAATATSLTITLSTSPAMAGDLTAVITTNTINSGAAVKVATVIPVVTASTTNLSAIATTVVISGFGFDATLANNIVSLNNGARGDVTAASATSITVTFSTNALTAGSLTAIVSTRGINSAAAISVATIIPVVTTSATGLAANASTLIINGFGFSPTAANNTVTLTNGVVGTVTSATTRSLTVNLTTLPTAAGSVTAVVTTNSLASSSAVQVATSVPVVTSSSGVLAADETTVTIDGFGFDTTPGNNTVVFNNGAAGTVTAATATSLTVTLSTSPASAGSLTAVVTTHSVSSGAAVQVADVTPIVTANTAHVAINTATLVINGLGFDPVAANNTVSLSNGAVGVVTTASATSLTVTFSFFPAAAGPLTASVTSNGVNSGAAVQVANSRPVVSSSTVNRAASAPTVTINGVGFDPIANRNLVAFNNGAIGTVTSATKTSLIVTFSIKPKTAGSLTAIVVTNSIPSGSAVQIATVIPVVTSSTTVLSASGTTLTINGAGFDPIANRNTVVLSNGAVGTVTTATTSSLIITLSTKPATAGSVTAIVTTNSNSSGAAKQVASVIPTVTAGNGNLLANAATLVISGFGFDPTAGNNTVALSNGAVGTVTLATATSLTVTLSTAPTASTSLTAVVTTNGQSSGTAVKVANALPVVTSSVLGQSITSTTLTINGFGFDPIANQNSVVLTNGAVGTVTAATTTRLTVTLSIRPNVLGSITAVVTTNTLGSGTAVQVATVLPVVNSTVTNIPINATTVTIAGAGFSTTAGLNIVTFNNGAVGTVTTATSTLLTVTITTRPATVGNLTAIVTVNTFASGAAVQIATVQPVVTLNVATLAASTATITINGFGFDTTPANNIVTFNNGAIGTVTAATATALTVALSQKPLAVGIQTAFVTTNGVSSGTQIQVAAILPAITTRTANLAASSNTIVINGFAFDPVASRNIVVFTNGAVGTVASATPTSLTVTFTTRPTAAGILTASVTSNGVASGTPVQVANVVPTVTRVTTDLGANSATATIRGFGFSTTPGNNTVVFSNGVTGTVTAATAILLTVTFTNKPTIVGNLTAVVTTNSLSSGAAVQIATVIPTITANTTALAAGTTTLTIAGYGFDTTLTNNTVTFDNGAVGIITAATATSLNVTFAALPNVAGPLNAVVTTKSYSSTSIQVAASIPAVTLNTASLAASSTTVVIEGSDFDPVASRNTVVFNNGAVGTVTSATFTQITVTFSIKPKTAGSLTAIVTTNGMVSGAAVQVATVTPVVTSSMTSLAINATTVTISGSGFDPVAANNTVVMNNGAIGTVTSATVSLLTVTFSTKPIALGTLTAIVTTNSQTSGTATQIATVAPAVTVATTSITAVDSTITITGAGFSTVAANNTVTFNNGAVGTVTTATATSLLVTFSTKPQTAGILTAVVTTSGSSSGAAIQVANVTPVVTLSTANLSILATTMTISGFGFSLIPGNNKVVFNNGAVGTVTASTATTLTITFSVKPKATGLLTALVTTNLLASPLAVQVASVI